VAQVAAPGRSLRARRRRRSRDVVFYMPAVGSLLSAEPRSYGGAEKQVLMLASALARRGYTVAIIVYGAPGELPADVDGVTIIPRRPYRSRSRITAKLVEVLTVWKSLWQAPSRAIVTRCAGVNVGMVAIYARIARRRFIFASCNLADFDCRKLLFRRRDQLIYELGVRLADAIVVQTEEQVEPCEAAFGLLPIVIKSLAAPAEPQVGEPMAFLWVGRLASYKRPLEYVELARAVPEARFWLIGVPQADVSNGVSVGAALIAAAAEVPNLELLEPRSSAEVGELMSRAVAAVGTADFEGMPNVLLEAWSRGVPALVLTHDPEGVITTHGLGGFANGSRDKLAALAREQWQTRKHRDELSRRCREYVASHHAPDVVAEQWREVLSVDRLPTESEPIAVGG
jgi:glycosyltransferase involved in cell wall biosynthesis